MHTRPCQLLHSFRRLHADVRDSPCDVYPLPLPTRCNLQDLGDTWAARNAFSYGRGVQGTARLNVLQALLASTDRVVQQVDSVEYGLTDIQEYYANTGALIAAAKSARQDTGRGGEVGCSVVEAFGGDPKPVEIDKLLRVEYRSKLLNPKWASAMAAQVCSLHTC
jgi:magnesium chelatase subunit H